MDTVRIRHAILRVHFPMTCRSGSLRLWYASGENSYICCRQPQTSQPRGERGGAVTQGLAGETYDKCTCQPGRHYRGRSQGIVLLGGTRHRLGSLEFPAELKSAAFYIVWESWTYQCTIAMSTDMRDDDITKSNDNGDVSVTSQLFFLRVTIPYFAMPTSHVCFNTRDE